MGITELRGRFEKWAKDENLNLKKSRLDYEDEQTYMAWRAWRAAIYDANILILQDAAEELLDALSEELKATEEAENLRKALGGRS